MLDLDLLAILRARVKPLMLTCRAESEGGRWADDDPRRRLALLEGVKRGYDYVDIEHRSGLLDVMNEKAGRGLVVSYHDLEGMPPDLDTLYAEMCQRRPDVVKIAVTPRSVADVGRVLAFARRAGDGRRAARGRHRHGSPRHRHPHPVRPPRRALHVRLRRRRRGVGAGTDTGIADGRASSASAA